MNVSVDVSNMLSIRRWGLDDVRGETGPRFASTSWAGSAGVGALQQCSDVDTFSAPDADIFSAQCRETAVHGLRIGEWTASPISGSFHGANRVPATVLLAVEEGSLQYTVDARSAVAEPGSLHLFSAEIQLSFDIPVRTRLFFVIVPDVLLPQNVRIGAAGCAGELAATGLTRAFRLVLNAALDEASGGALTPAASAISSLAIAVIQERAQAAPDADLRAQIVDHIERHIADRTLSPRSVSEAVGISLRWLHLRFNTDGIPVARYILQRRLDLVAAQLQNDQHRPSSSALAPRYGFSSPGHLARAFKIRYGVTLAGYAARTSEGDPPQPLDPAQDATG